MSDDLSNHPLTRAHFYPVVFYEVLRIKGWMADQVNISAAEWAIPVVATINRDRRDVCLAPVRYHVKKPKWGEGPFAWEIRLSGTDEYFRGCPR